MSDCLMTQARQTQNAASLASCSISVVVTTMSKMEVIEYQDVIVRRPCRKHLLFIVGPSYFPVPVLVLGPPNNDAPPQMPLMMTHHIRSGNLSIPEYSTYYQRALISSYVIYTRASSHFVPDVFLETSRIAPVSSIRNNHIIAYHLYHIILSHFYTLAPA